MTSDGTSGKADSDAFATLGWGLRKYRWVVALFMLASAVLVPTLLSQVPQRYEAQAQVGPTGEINLPNLDPLPRLAESLFSNGTVEAAVRESFEPPLPASVSVIPERVELLAPQDNVVFTVIGRGPTPNSAAQTANVAAVALTTELNNYTESVGQFTIHQSAEKPEVPIPAIGRPLATGIGILAGLVNGLALIVGVLAWRRPVINTSAAESIGAPVLARVDFGNRGGIRGLPQLCHSVISHPINVLFLAGEHNTQRERRELATKLVAILGLTHAARVIRRSDLNTLTQPQTGAGSGAEFPELIIVDGPTQAELAARPKESLTLLIVREGIPSATLQRQLEHYLDPGRSGVVLVRNSRWQPYRWLGRMGRSRSRDPVAPSAVDSAYEPEDSPLTEAEAAGRARIDAS